ncbi:MAG: sugar phosphate isomerase/epimerase family protein [Bryobacteraceae bacterium]
MTRREFNLLGMAAALALKSQARSTARFDYPWKLGVITDEVSMDLPRVLGSFVPKYGLRWVEIRDVKLSGTRRYVYRGATPAQLRQIKRQLDDAGVQLSVLDTAIYKIALPGTHPLGKNKHNPNTVEDEYKRQMEDLKRAAEAAHTLGTDRVRVFTFKRLAHPNAIFDRIVDNLNRALMVAKQHGVTLLVENEFDCNVATGSETARLFRAITDRRLMHNWDPGNCFMAGEQPYPKAWDQLDHSRIGHMHLKDAEGKKWMPIGKGKIDFVGQFRALKKMGYSHTMSLETHYRNAQRDPYTSSEESMDGLVAVLKKV